MKCIQNRAEILKQQLLKHTRKKPDQFEIYPKSYGRTKKKKNQHRLKHIGERPYKCEMRSKAFGRAETIKQHRLAKNLISVKCVQNHLVEQNI